MESGASPAGLHREDLWGELSTRGPRLVGRQKSLVLDQVCTNRGLRSGFKRNLQQL
jgi:hypothetical protein